MNGEGVGGGGGEESVGGNRNEGVIGEEVNLFNELESTGTREVTY